VEGEFSRRAGWLVTLRMLLGGLIVFLLTGGAVATAGLLQVNGLAREFKDRGHKAAFKPDTITKPEPGKPQTLLLVGSDHRYGDPGKDARSDTLMLVRIDPRQRATTVLSVPRDLAVEIPGRGLAKINETYTIGGLDLTTRTVKKLLSTDGESFRINHAVATTFGGFVEAVNQLHCVYLDIDRRYYHMNAGLPVSQHWSEIDVRAGYQRLCGSEALSYVRFRHLDNDIVRSARQQGFLRAAKDQLRKQGLLSNLRPLVRIVARATETDEDLQSTRGLLRLGKLAVSASGKPVRQVRFPATFVMPGAASAVGTHPELGSFVTASPSQIRAAVREFMHPSAPRKPVRTARHARRARRASRSDGLRDANAQAVALVRAARSRRRTRMPIFAPRRLTPRGNFPVSTSLAPNPRRYVIADSSGRRHAAYRIVVTEDASQGQYYGVQGTTWRTPPILAATHQNRRIGRRTFSLYTDGGHLRLVAWRTPKGVFWLSNTLSLDLSNSQMLAIAASTQRVAPR
jgi:LCP family protein required for cell wall assembly